MSKKLPIFEGYSVDVHLKQFRKVKNNQIEFIGFDSIKGEKILNKYIKYLNSKSRDFKELIRYF